jgi:hypothetical protein
MPIILKQIMPIRFHNFVILTHFDLELKIEGEQKIKKMVEGTMSLDAVIKEAVDLVCQNMTLIHVSVSVLRRCETLRRVRHYTHLPSDVLDI